jgi:hypothetical protein
MGALLSSEGNRDAETVLVLSPVASRQGNRAVVSSRPVANVDFLWKRARPRTERANAAVHPSTGSNARGSHLSSHRPSQPADIPLRVGKMPTGTKEGGQKRLAPSGPGPTYTGARFPLSLSLSLRGLSVCFFCFCSARQAGRLAGLGARTGCCNGTRTLASLPTSFPGPSHASFLRRRRF